MKLKTFFLFSVCLTLAGIVQSLYTSSQSQTRGRRDVITALRRRDSRTEAVCIDVVSFWNASVAERTLPAMAGYAGFWYLEAYLNHQLRQEFRF